MGNRWVRALVKTLIVLLIVHVVLLLLGFLFGTRIGWFGLPMIWPHWHSAWESILAIIAGVILYGCIYVWFTEEA